MSSRTFDWVHLFSFSACLVMLCIKSMCLTVRSRSESILHCGIIKKFQHITNMRERERENNKHHPKILTGKIECGITFDPLGTSSLNSLMRSWINCLSLGLGLQLSPGLALFLLSLAGSCPLSNRPQNVLWLLDENPFEELRPHASELKQCNDSFSTRD